MMRFDREWGMRGLSLYKARAFSIHILTATGGGCAFLALIEAINGEWPRMFLWLGFALIIDTIDGPLARYFHVREALPEWSGETLDLVVDFLTYVLVPAYAIAASGLLPEALAIPAGIVIVMTSALYFADRRMKTHDYYFRGFPGLWNLFAFYLLLLSPPSWLALSAVVLLAILTFVPVPFIHPVRVAHLRYFNLGILVLWAVLAIVTLFHGMAPGPWITAALCAIALYFLFGGVLRRMI